VDPGKNLAQSQELVDFLDTSPYRQIALGDFNSIVEPFDGFFVPTGSDQKMLDNQFKDTWLEKGGGAPGFTWRDDELLNQLPTDFTQRLDYVFQRGGFSTQSVDIIGEDPLCPLPPATGPCWGSDHAGVLATLAFAPEPGSLALLGLGFALAAWRRRTTA
jgi:endonuclease/exonuclease/phosphatase family metal-dependent hydrolase